MEFNVKLDVDQVKVALLHMRDGEVSKAAVAAMNRAGSAVKQRAIKEVYKQRNLPKAEITSHIIWRKAYGEHLVTTIRASGRPISLRVYGAHNTAHGVSVKVMRDGQRKIVHSHGNKAFVYSRGHRAPRGAAAGPLMVRLGRERLPIEKLYGPSIPTAFVKHVVMEGFKRIADEKWTERFNHEIAFRFKQAGFDVKG